MLLLSMCDKSYMLEIFLIIKIFLQLVCYIVPSIIIIISIINLFKVIQSGKQDDMKDILKIFARRIIAGLLVIFIPTLVNYVFTDLIDGSGVEIVACMESATKEKVESLKEAEEAEAAAEAEAKAKEDEEKQKAAYEEEHKNDEAKKEAFENAKQNHSSSSSSTTASGDVQKLFTAAKKVDNLTYTGGYSYGHSSTWDGSNYSNKLVACDRGVGLVLYFAGYTQVSPEQLTLAGLETYLPQWGFTKITNYSDIQPGDIVFYDRAHNGYMDSSDHVFLVGETVNQRYDWGSDARIQHTGQYSGGMPFTEPISQEEFGWAYRMPSKK